MPHSTLSIFSFGNKYIMINLKSSRIWQGDFWKQGCMTILLIFFDWTDPTDRSLLFRFLMREKPLVLSFYLLGLS